MYDTAFNTRVLAANFWIWQTDDRESVFDLFDSKICKQYLFAIVFFLIKLPPFIKSKSFMQWFFSLRSPYANLALISVCCNRSKWHRISVSIRFSSTFYLKNGVSLHQLHTNFITKFTNHFGFSHTCTWNLEFFLFQHCNSLAFVHNWFVIQSNMRICEALKHSNFHSTHTSIDKMYYMFAFNIMGIFCVLMSLFTLIET